MGYYLVLILVIHWVGDFICQPRYIADQKSNSLRLLAAHVAIYTVVWLIALACTFAISPIPNAAQVVIQVSFWIYLSHFATDLITSKITTYFYEKDNYYMFFNSIGFDQILHYIQIAIIFDIYHIISL